MGLCLPTPKACVAFWSQCLTKRCAALYWGRPTVSDPERSRAWRSMSYFQRAGATGRTSRHASEGAARPPLPEGAGVWLVTDLGKTTKHGSSLARLPLGARVSGHSALASLGGTHRDTRGREVGRGSDEGGQQHRERCPRAWSRETPQRRARAFLSRTGGGSGGFFFVRGLIGLCSGPARNAASQTSSRGSAVAR